jgi:hypothetical protein
MRTKNIAKKDIESKGDDVLTHAKDSEEGGHLLGRKSMLVGMLTSGFVVATVAHPSSSMAAGTIKPAPVAATSPTYISVRSYGAVGDGVTLDQAAINAAITANPGRDIHLTAGSLGTVVYQIDANYAGGKGIRLNQPGTQLVLDPGVTIRVNPNALGRYAAITVTAADCSVSGGAIVGDLGSHTGTTGEWGHGIDIQDAAHRCKVQGVHISKCWGDGIIICDTASSYTTGAKPADVSIIDVVSDGNRRQGMSIITALRPRVIGGTFMNTGGTDPQAGIDIEPNPGGLQDVIDFSVIGAVMQGNAGRGLTVHAQGRTARGTVQGVRSIGNTYEGFSTESTAEVEFVGCTANGNKNYGFTVQTATSARNVFTGCTAEANTQLGFCLPTWAEAIGCNARNNGWAGFYLSGSGTATSCTATGNNTASTYYGQFAIEDGTAARMVGCLSSVGTNAAQPTKGFEVKSGSTGSRIISCDTIGTFTGGSFVDGGTVTSAFPIPGAPKPTGVPVTVAAVHAALCSLGAICA